MEARLSVFFDFDTAKKAGLLERKGDNDPVITGLEYVAQNVKKGNIFFAMPGLHTDGHIYINDAILKGAAAVVYESDWQDEKEARGESLSAADDQIVLIRVKNSRYAMSPIAAAFYGHPSRRLAVIGVTGTEGKSTTVFLIWQLLTLMGKKAGFVSTVQHSVGGQAQNNSEHQTTPEATAVHRMLREMADNGCEYAVVESSSHGLSRRTNRLGDVVFTAAVMTNVTHEHLEFHGTWEQYRDDKANLFRALDKTAALGSFAFSGTGFSGGKIPPEIFGVVNADDKSADFFAQATKQKVYGFSAAGNDCDLSLLSIKAGADGNSYKVFDKAANREIAVRDYLPGAFNSGNVMAALLVVSHITGSQVSDIASLAEKLVPVRGRMTAIALGQPFEVVVDYAHTPSSFGTIFPPLYGRINSGGGRIIALFGSAGERDTQKRREQGKIAALYSGVIILTDEDPRGENPADILEEIAAGIESAYAAEESSAGEKAVIETESANEKARAQVFRRGENLFLIPDRPAAIRKAMSLAGPKDLVLLLGKGHENSIIYADRIMPFDEIEEAKRALELLCPTAL